MPSVDLKECYMDFQIGLDEQFTAFFQNYTQEEDESIHSSNFDLNNSTTHLIKTFFSDVLSLQAEKNNIKNASEEPEETSKLCKLYFLPVMMFCSNETIKKFCFWKMNYPNLLFGDEAKPLDENVFDELIKSINKNEKTSIENLLVSSYGELFKSLSSSSVIDDQSYTASTINIYNKMVKTEYWNDIIFKQIINIDELDAAINASTSPTNGCDKFKRFDFQYKDKAQEITFSVVFYISDLTVHNDAEIFCSKNCLELTLDKKIEKALHRLFQRLFCIAIFLRKIVTYNSEHEQFAALQGKEALFGKIHEPLKKMIEHLNKSTYLISYIDRQLNPPWQGLLKLSKSKELSKIFDKKAEIKYKKRDSSQIMTFNGYHDFETNYTKLRTDGKKEFTEFIDKVKDYLWYIRYGDDIASNTEVITDSDHMDILNLLYELQNELSIKERYDLLIFIKLITYDIQDKTKSVTFLQILYYVALGFKQSITYYVDNKVYDNGFSGQLSIDNMKYILNTPIFKKTITNYSHVHNGLSSKLYPTVKLPWEESPAELCAALAGLVGEELQGKVKASSIHIVSLPTGNHIGITIKCIGIFDEKSPLRKHDEDVSTEDKLYHGMRNTLRIIEKAVGIKRKFVDSDNDLDDLAKCYHPFTIHCTGKAKNTTVIRIIIGDIFTCKCNFTKNDFIKCGSP